MMCTRAALRRLLIATPMGLAGCASVMSPGVTPEVRTIASVGDKPLPILSGPPGDTVVAAREAPAVKARPDGRVSGRVFDEKGRPVPNAQVRLAVGGAERGRAVNTVSDESGAFTLRGLKRGVSYTVVVESEDGQEIRSGRAEVEAPEHDVRIALAPDEAPRRADAEPSDAPRRVGRVSDRRKASVEERDDASGHDPAPRVNHEDLPPAEEAGAASGIDDLETPPEDEPPAPRPKGRSKAAPAPSGWHRPGATGDREASQAAGVEPDLQDSEELAASQESEEPAPKSRKAPAFSPTPVEEASEPLEQASEREPRADATREPVADAPRTEEPAATPEPKTAEAKTADLPPIDEPKAAEPAPVVEAKAAEPAPVNEAKAAEPKPAADIQPPAAAAPAPVATEPPATTPVEPAPKVAEPPAEAPKTADAAPQAESLPDLLDPVVGAGAVPPAAAPEAKEAAATTPAATTPAAEPAPTPAPPETPASPQAAAPAPAAEAQADPMPSTSSPIPGEPTAAPSTSQADTNPAEAVGTAAKAADVGAPQKRTTWGELKAPAAPAKVLAAEPRRSLLGLRNRPPAKPVAEAAAGVAAVAAECKMDGRRNQILDFRLPDTEGRPVRFKDLDADLVLLDFWGTWCPPCIQSVPHLVALQDRIGAGRLKVIGIAYEKSGSAAARAAAVTAAASKLGINYQVLLGDADTCPLQAALHVQAYPTMVLLDREGRILWRDQGSSAGTLARLDRVIDAQSAPAVARR